MHSFWEIVASNSLIVVVLAIAVALLGRIWKNPVVMHLLCILVLLKLITPPILTIPLRLPMGTPPVMSSDANTASQMSQALPVEVAGQTALAAVPARTEDLQIAENMPPRDIPASSPVGVPPAAMGRHALPWRTLLAWIWGIGIIVLASVHASRIRRFARLLCAAEAAPATLLNMANGIGQRLGLKRMPKIVMLPVRVSPLVWSLGGRPRVILPTELFRRLDAEGKEAIIAHELAHVRRKDHWVRMLELIVSTLFWWHPVVWWACRQLRELEEQCCDGMVVGAGPHGVKTYAAALLDTLDFLSEQSVVAPLGATAARSFVSISRRIGMLRERTFVARLTLGRLAAVAAIAAVPMVLAFAAETPAAKEPSKSDPQIVKEPKSDEKPAVQRRTINKLVTDFPEPVDLSTPESAVAAHHRAFANPDPKFWLDLSAWKYSQRDVADIKRKMESHKDELAKNNEAYRNAEIIEVITYRDGLAEVISKLNVSGTSRNPYSARSVVRIDGAWKNFGENRLASLEEARQDFERTKDNRWASYLRVLDGIAKGKPVRLEAGDLSSSRPKRSAPIAPGEELGISVEKADLMGRVEWAMMHGMHDITARKTIEWGDIENDKDGNRTIRYKFYATIWDKDVYIMNEVFTFDAKGNILDMEDVDGFPQKKEIKPADVSTQQGMKELVEDFFSKNYRDITSRETIEWGEVTKNEDGNSSIRYKFRATIWDKDVMVMNQVFTFDPKGQYVSVKNVEGFPQKQ